MKRFFIVILIFIVSFTPPGINKGLAQPSDYDHIFNAREIIFFDDFDHYSNQWLLGVEEGNWTETLDSGYLFFQSHNDKPKEDVIPVIINTKRDFEIEAVIKFLRGSMNQAFGIQYGKSNKGNKQYDFFIAANGQYSIDKYDDGFTDYIPFRESEYVNRYAPNKLTIRKVSDTSYFFLNEQLVHQMPFQPFFGNLTGIQVGANSSIIADYFRVEYLDQEKDSLSKILIIDYTHTINEYINEKTQSITLTVQFINAGTKPAEELEISVQAPWNVKVLETKKFSSLKPSEIKEITVKLYPTQDFQENKIKIDFDIQGADINNAEDIGLTLFLDEPAKASHDKLLVQTYSEYRGEDPLKGLNIAKSQQNLEIGKYYAFIIGIDKFQGEWSPLQNAVNDAKSLKRILEEKYHFDHIKTLYDEEATRDNIMKAFEWLMDTLTDNDNLLIFYSGHGSYNEQMDRGFWVPVDAREKKMHLYISNEEIRTFMAGIRSKHTLLVTDACFSGDIFRGKTLTIPYENSTKYYNKVYSLTSRKALTSGGLEPVQDRGREGHSVFGYYLLKALEINTNRFMDANELYNSIKIPVINNSEQTPLYNPVYNTGDEGGQFIFITK